MAIAKRRAPRKPAKPYTFGTRRKSKAENFSKHLTEEDRIQVAGLRYAALAYKDLDIIHVANEAQRSEFESWRFNELGGRLGFSDLILDAYGVTGYIEVKTAKGKLSPYQKKFIELKQARGFFVRVTYGPDELRQAIDDFMKQFKA